MPTQHYIAPNENNPSRNAYPWRCMAIGDYLIDYDAEVDWQRTRIGQRPWRWKRCNAYASAMNLQKRDPQYVFTGRLERAADDSVIGVRVTREDPALRSIDSILAALAALAADAQPGEWRRGQELGLDPSRPANVRLAALREFARPLISQREHPLL